MVGALTSKSSKTIKWKKLITLTESAFFVPIILVNLNLNLNLNLNHEAWAMKHEHETWNLILLSFTITAWMFYFEQ